MPGDYEHRLYTLECEMQEVSKDVKAIMTNHLPHIQVEIMRLSTLLKIFGGLILAAVGALIALAIGG